MRRLSERLAAKGTASPRVESPFEGRLRKRASTNTPDNDAASVPEDKETPSGKKRKRGKQSEDLKARKRKEHYKNRREEDAVESSSDDDDDEDIPAVPVPKNEKGKGKAKEKATVTSSSKAAESDSEGKEYQVEAIVGKKVKDGEKYYRVKWAGYPESKNTWEPQTNLRKARSLIREYLSKQSKK